MGAKAIEVRASHLAVISHLEEIAQLILEAAGYQSSYCRCVGVRTPRQKGPLLRGSGA
jgi:hypothetical protein